MSPSVIVDQISADGGRRVSVRSGGRTHILGIAYSDHFTDHFQVDRFARW
ncbi:hypothetical protein ABT126_42225 [Streptomyces sp. NPDC002012]